MSLFVGSVFVLLVLWLVFWDRQCPHCGKVSTGKSTWPVCPYCQRDRRDTPPGGKALDK